MKKYPANLYIYCQACILPDKYVILSTIFPNPSLQSFFRSSEMKPKGEKTSSFFDFSISKVIIAGTDDRLIPQSSIGQRVLQSA
uniref:Uncharacterized protein n=1 Tax=Romanomermis culicivorax TaxID=13658 RepID=A0A915LCS8_ROMCU